MRRGAESTRARKTFARITGRSPRNLWQPRHSNGAGMKTKEKNKAGAPTAALSKEPDRQKEIERQKEIDRQKEIERLEKDVEELRHLAANADSDAELQRIPTQVSKFRPEFSTHS